MAKNFSELEDSNESANPSIHMQSSTQSGRDRRQVIQGGLAAWMGAVFGGGLLGCAGTNLGVGISLPIGSHGSISLGGAVPVPTGQKAAAQTAPLLGFKGIPTDSTDRLVIPEGYTAQVFAPWGTPIGSTLGSPAFKADGSNTADEQALQMGMHHDGMHYYPLQADRGLLVMNHEYVDDGLLHKDGHLPWTADKVRKSQAAHGVTVIEVMKGAGGGWSMVSPSKYARRFTANTPFSIGGPARGHKLMQTVADPQGLMALGTFNNCAAGQTPWGTYLSGEENFAFYFNAGKLDSGSALDAHHKRWGLRDKGFFGWGDFDARFDVSKTPHEPNRCGWVVEIDPMDPTSTPVKRTALGRAAHEGAWVAVTKDKRAVVYSGEDARFEYIYKFVSRDAIKEAGNGLTKAQANRELLDHGTLYVARFDADGTGKWLPLVHSTGGLTAANGFADQGEVVIKPRQASDLLGGTKMDRPEWLAIDQAAGEVYCTLTNNSQRGTPNMPAVDAANPRAKNDFGGIIKWKESVDFDSNSFTWSHLVLAGDPSNERSEAKGKPAKLGAATDIFACPDGLALDARGVLWIQTDTHASQMYKGEMLRVGNNQMLAMDRNTGEIRRFLTGPVNSEITGATFTPDMKTMFINIQHPGESAGDRSDPAFPDKFSNWPSGGKGDRPRSATVIIQRADGGVVGA